MKFWDKVNIKQPNLTDTRCGNWFSGGFANLNKTGGPN